MSASFCHMIPVLSGCCICIPRSERGQDDEEGEEEEEDDNEEEILGSDDDEQESPSDYVKGGYHPVRIGDLFHNRYHVLFNQ